MSAMRQASKRPAARKGSVAVVSAPPLPVSPPDRLDELICCLLTTRDCLRDMAPTPQITRMMLTIDTALDLEDTA